MWVDEGKKCSFVGAIIKKQLRNTGLEVFHCFILSCGMYVTQRDVKLKKTTDLISQVPDLTDVTSILSKYSSNTFLREIYIQRYTFKPLFSSTLFFHSKMFKICI